MFKKLFGSKDTNLKGDSRVGTPLRWLYNDLDPQQKVIFKESISRVPSRGELTIKLGQSSDNAASAIQKMAEQWLKELSVQKWTVVGLVKASGNYVLYIKGYFGESERAKLQAFFEKYVDEVRSHMSAAAASELDMGIFSGCFEDESLRELN
jgi:hypothetical protein